MTIISPSKTLQPATGFAPKDERARPGHWEERFGLASKDDATAATLLQRARILAEEVRRRAQEIDTASKLPDDLVQSFVDLELVSILTPRRYGGSELGLETASEVIRAVAAADQATAWVLAFYIGHNWIHCQFPEEGQREIYANGPSPRSAGVLAPTLKLKAVEGGYIARGRNGWNSGSPHADWIMGSGMVVEGDGPKGPVTLILPIHEVTLADTWDVQGMRATGSWDAIYDDVFVPAHRTVPSMALMAGPSPGSALHANPLYARPLILVTLAYCLGPFVGALRGAADEFVRTTRTRIGANDGKAVNEKPTAHMRAGRGAANAAMAEALLAEMVRLAASAEAQTMDLEGRLAFKARTAALATFCKEAVTDLALGSGASAFRSESSMQRAFRNINMISIHAFFDNDSSMEAYGRALLGLDPNSPI